MWAPRSQLPLALGERRAEGRAGREEEKELFVVKKITFIPPLVFLDASKPEDSKGRGVLHLNPEGGPTRGLEHTGPAGSSLSATPLVKGAGQQREGAGEEGSVEGERLEQRGEKEGGGNQEQRWKNTCKRGGERKR